MALLLSRLRSATHGVLLVAVASAGSALAPAVLRAQAATPVPPVGAGLRLVRSTSGSRGTLQGGRYVIEDPRTAFSLATDHQVVVHFEWEGRPGAYRCEGRWKDPTGKVVLMAPLEYQATSRRFGLYWTLALPTTATPGLWALEVYADGEVVGTHTFEVMASGATPAGRRPLSPAEIYQRALAAVATLEAVGSAGEMLSQGVAVALDADHVATAFPSIEGATTLRLRTASGGRVETQAVSAWNRRQGWAILRIPGHGLAPLLRAASFPAVGERCFVLSTAEDGSRVIGEASIVGQEPPPLGRPRLNSGFAAGSPALDERGDMVGIVVGGSDEMLGSSSMLNSLSGGHVAVANGTLVVPIARLPDAPGVGASLAELAARGEFLRPLSADQRHVVSGVFAGRVQRGGVVPMPQDQRVVFSRREDVVSLFIQWNPQEKKDTVSRLEVYDADYRKVMDGQPSKLKLRTGEYLFSTWTVPIDGLAPAVYRVDVLLGDAPVWRGYLRITD